MTDAYAPHAPLGAGAEPQARAIANTWSERERFAAIVDALPADADRILDVGCVRHGRDRRAYGNLHAQLHASFPDADVIGIDTDADELDRMDAPGYDVRHADAETFALAAPVGAIVAGELIEHLENPGRFLRRAAEFLRPEGTLVVTTPNPSALRYWRKAFRGEWTSEHHTCWVSPQHLATLCERVGGLAVESVDYLAPPGGWVSGWLFGHGHERMSGTTYVATVRRENV